MANREASGTLLFHIEASTTPRAAHASRFTGMNKDVEMHIDQILIEPERTTLALPLGRVASAAETALQARGIDRVVKITLTSLRILEAAYSATFSIEHNDYAWQDREPQTVTISLTRPTLHTVFKALTPGAVATAVARQSDVVADIAKIGVAEITKAAAPAHRRAEAFS
ncbi:hypothetical protein NKH41_03325 [Mesorhizobium sp. M1169]|uniref:hypothetical protein n=1 Tax=unclassified Mesorhizobium TaxID=325217 RepID=UPI00333C09AB